MEYVNKYFQRNMQWNILSTIKENFQQNILLVINVADGAPSKK